MEENYSSARRSDEVGFLDYVGLVAEVAVICACLYASDSLDKISHGLNSYLTQPIISQQESQEAQRSQESELTKIVDN